MNSLGLALSPLCRRTALLFLCFTALPLSAQDLAAPVPADPSADLAFAGNPPLGSHAATPSPSSSSAPVVLGIPRIQSRVEVDASRPAFESGVSANYHFTASQVLSSAGTWGDFTRYLQLMPGVAWNSDMSNDVMVRGGSPEENLYVVDGIEVPNINHIAVEGTTGGFTSMLDTATISSIDFKVGAYDARYSSRLSSLVEIHTLSSQEGRRSGELDMGISGGGGFLQQPLGKKASLLLSAHRSMLNIVTNDIGLNGVPVYTNALASLEWSPSNRDHLTALSLSGTDAIDIHPQPCDPGITTPFRTEYSGKRSTEGMVWQHTHSAHMLSTVTASYSLQGQDIGQQQLSTTHFLQDGCFSQPDQGMSAYQEHTRDGISTLQYGFQFDRRGWLVSFGEAGRLVQLDYRVNQPLGQQSPFNSNPAWTDANAFARNILTGRTATYGETSLQLGTRWTFIAGAREETFALTGAQAFDPRASVGFRFGHHAISAAFARSSQLPPAIDILSYPGNSRLRPLRMEQISAGAELWSSGTVTASLQAYHKRYFNEPESTEYPSLMLANMVDTLGQQFVWLPLQNGGRGHSQGIELTVRAHWKDRVEVLSSASYSRTRYAAADGVFRPGNFDFPLLINGMATLRLPGNVFAAIRNTYASGRPYTPFDIAASEQQSRGIYDLSQVNALRGPAYNRLDADFHRAFRVRGSMLTVYGGVENALNRHNFLGYAWENECRAPYGTVCGENVNAIPGVPEYEVTQMPVFPSFGAHLRF